MLATEIVARVEKDPSLEPGERAGRIEIIRVLDRFSRTVEKDLRSESWPERSARQMMGRALFRGVADIGWYDEGERAKDRQVDELFEAVHRLAEGYRRLPEIK